MHKVLLQFLLSFILLAVTESAESHMWRRIGPPAGGIERIVADPQQSNLWFVINQGVLYRTENGGQNWTSASPPEFRVLSISIHPITSHIFVLLLEKSVTQTVLWTSQDQGKSFRSIAIGVGRIDLFAVARYEELFESRDGGKHWKSITSELAQDIQVKALSDPRIQPFCIATNKGVFQEVQDR